MAFQDRTLTCKDCGQSFTFTAREQEFFQQKGYTNEPGRCLPCRQNARSSRGGSSYGGGDRQMHTAVCASCGKDAQVPFQPRGDRPVYCSDCFTKVRTSSQR